VEKFKKLDKAFKIVTDHEKKLKKYECRFCRNGDDDQCEMVISLGTKKEDKADDEIQNLAGILNHARDNWKEFIKLGEKK